ncbi:MAG: glycosyltransferase [Gemmataceae bacterium]|nr:glycosyltransferase [Gemmataceae bacterium]MDW8265599.1 glycosyltransferase [Gemmataceae bacterium]
MRVSLCMIVRNEEASLPACLATVSDLVDEIVVVDTGSTDHTRQRAIQLGARVYDFPWCDDFAAARNESLRHASGDWIFWMDADDRLDAVNRERFRRLKDQLTDEVAIYVMPCLCSRGLGPGTGFYLDHARLFRRHPLLRWQYRVHERILPAGSSPGLVYRRSDVVIHHEGYEDPAQKRLKLERNRRLGHLDLAERPDDPVVLFNLGWTYLSLHRPQDAIPLLQRSLALSMPAASHVAKLHSLLSAAFSLLGQKDEAWAICLQGRHRCPHDDELLFQQAMLSSERGDLAGAEACLHQLLAKPPGPHRFGLAQGLRGHLARHNLAIVLRAQGRLAEAEAQWQQLIAEQPDYVPAWMGLTDLYLAHDRCAEMEELVARLRADPRRQVEAGLVEARLRLKGRDFAGARAALAPVLAAAPRLLEARIVLSHVLIEEGRDWPAAVRALEDVLALDPTNAQAKHNLAVIRSWQW